MAPKRPRGAGAFLKPVESPAPKPPDPSELYAALDLGTNSCRMLIAQPKGNQFHVVDSFSKSVQLGSGLESTGRLSRGSMRRTIQALRICQQKLKRHKVQRMRLGQVGAMVALEVLLGQGTVRANAVQQKARCRAEV